MRLVADRAHHRHAPIAVLRDIAFTVEPGRIVRVIGPSGRGKSTLVAIVLLVAGEMIGAQFGIGAYM